jgi:hypothetical protein
MEPSAGESEPVNHARIGGEYTIQIQSKSVVELSRKQGMGKFTRVFLGVLLERDVPAARGVRIPLATSHSLAIGGCPSTGKCASSWIS